MQPSEWRGPVVEVEVALVAFEIHPRTILADLLMLDEAAPLCYLCQAYLNAVIGRDDVRSSISS